MGNIFKATFESDFRNAQGRVLKLGRGIIEALPEQPSAGWLLKMGLELSFERRKAAMAKPRVFLQRKVEPEIGFHDFWDRGRIVLTDVPEVSGEFRIFATRQNAHDQFP